MSLITMGLGHLTIVTFGLGNGVIVGGVQIIGEAEPEISFVEVPYNLEKNLSIEEKKPNINIKDEHLNIGAKNKSPEIKFQKRSVRR